LSCGTTANPDLSGIITIRLEEGRGRPDRE
jgi:hypothetical protein